MKGTKIQEEPWRLGNLNSKSSSLKNWIWWLEFH